MENPDSAPFYNAKMQTERRVGVFYLSKLNSETEPPQNTTV